MDFDRRLCSSTFDFTWFCAVCAAPAAATAPPPPPPCLCMVTVGSGSALLPVAFADSSRKGMGKSDAHVRRGAC